MEEGASHCLWLPGKYLEEPPPMFHLTVGMWLNQAGSG